MSQRHDSTSLDCSLCAPVDNIFRVHKQLLAVSCPHSMSIQMKRDDLQSVRGVAILLVLLFHLHPRLFPLGFVGVDMFFVLSGFLMTMILSKTSFSSSSLWDFYSRRFKRIVPLLYVVLVGVYAGCSFLLFGPDKDQLKTDLVWSLSFLSNIQPLYEVLGYWDQVISYRFLVHCWSLGVEIQFYLIAPFIIFGTNQLSSLHRKGVLLSLVLCSFYFQLKSPPKMAYGLLPSRIWQFLLGSLCHEPEKTDNQLIIEKESLLDDRDGEEEPVKKKSGQPLVNHVSSLFLLLTCLVVIFNEQFLVDESAMRILGSLVVAVVIVCPSSLLAASRLLVYIGDISYVMYLVHWPMIVAAKYIENVEQLPVIHSIYLALLITVLSVFLHHTIEKFILKSSLFMGFVLSVISVAVILSTFPYYDQCCHLTRSTTLKDINITEAIEYNVRQSKVVYFNLPCMKDNLTSKWTNYTEEWQLRCQTYGNGTAKVLVIGNSMAYRAFPLIHKVFHGRYKELRLYSRSARPPLTDWDPPFTKAAHTVVDKIRPDILWNIHVSYDRYARPFNEKNKTSDRGYLEIERNLNYYKNRTRIFLIDLPFYWSNVTVAYEMAKRLRQRKPVDNLKIAKNEMVKEQMYHRRRIQAVPCDNCVYLDVESRMVDHGIYWFYNPKNYHAYTKDGAHFTWEMLDRIEPLYKKTVDDALRKLTM